LLKASNLLYSDCIVFLFEVNTSTTSFSYYYKRIVEMPEKLVLYYWKIQGLVAPLKMACTYARMDYEFYAFEATHSALWFDNIKPKIAEKNPLANLPFIKDGDFYVTQSNACLTYLGRKLDLLGKDERELCYVEQLLCQVMDLRNQFVNLCYGDLEGFQEKAKDYIEKKASVHFNKFENWLSVFQFKFLISNEKPSVADFHLFVMLDHHEKLAKEILKTSVLNNYKRLSSLYHEIRHLPQLKAYFESQDYKLPINSPAAAFC
jgi:glutathione S-transferase